MEFNNVVAYCKGFYIPRKGGVSEMWKDFAHCINIDGWNVYTKRDVTIWCIHRLEDFAKEFPEEAWKVSFGSFYSKIENNKDIYRISTRCKANNAELDDNDFIIWTFRDFIRYLDGDLFSDGVIPNEYVLPLNKDVSDSLWNKITSKYKEQKFDKWYQDDYETIENKLK